MHFPWCFENIKKIIVIPHVHTEFLSHRNSLVLGGGYKLWKRLSFFVAFPAVGLCMLNTYLEHQKMTVHRPEFVKYEYLRVRNKRFPWGDGTKSFFHVSFSSVDAHRTGSDGLIFQNPALNALPDGYEDGGHGGHH